MHDYVYGDVCVSPLFLLELARRYPVYYLLLIFVGYCSDDKHSVVRCSYADASSILGISKKEAKKCLDFLVDVGWIQRIRRANYQVMPCSGVLMVAEMKRDIEKYFDFSSNEIQEK